MPTYSHHYITSPFPTKQTSSSSGGNAGHGNGNGRTGEKGSKKQRQGKGKSKENHMDVQQDVEEQVLGEHHDVEKEVEEGKGVHEMQYEEREKDEAKEKRKTKQQAMVSEGEGDMVGMIESKEQPNDINVSSTIAVAGTADTVTATATTVATLDSQTSDPSPGQNLALDSHAVTHQSFFNAVIVPSCQPGNIVCSASQHRYTKPIRPNLSTISILAVLRCLILFLLLFYSISIVITPVSLTELFSSHLNLLCHHISHFFNLISIVITPVSLSELLRSQGKGTDASNFYDEEVSIFTRSHIYST